MHDDEGRRRAFEILVLKLFFFSPFRAIFLFARELHHIAPPFSPNPPLWRCCQINHKNLCCELSKIVALKKHLFKQNEYSAARYEYEDVSFKLSVVEKITENQEVKISVLLLACWWSGNAVLMLSRDFWVLTITIINNKAFPLVLLSCAGCWTLVWSFVISHIPHFFVKRRSV